MRSTPMVSVIVPNYNHAPYLKQRIDSVLDQTYHNYELIILDDCSTDNSREIIAQYTGHEKISHIIFNEINSGNTFIQWQKGIELAKGKYIWIAESDDWCEPILLETLVHGLQSNHKCVLAYAQSYIIKGENTVDKVSCSDSIQQYVNGKEYISTYLVKYNSIFNASMCMFKKQNYEHVSSRFTTFKFCGDWLLWIEIANQGDVFISGKLLNYFRKHKGDITSNALASGYNYIEELAILKILVNEQFISRPQFKTQLLNSYIGYLLNKKKLEKSVRKEIEDTFYFNNNESYKKFLVLRANLLTLFKLKVKRRLSN